MAKYTIELGTIEERSKCGVFDFDYDFYEPVLKKNFEEKFIDHYFFDEIGFETIQRFKKRLRSTLNKMMPYYTQLYRTQVESENINFLLNKDLIETTSRKKDNSELSKLDVNNTANSDYKESNLNDGNATLSYNDLTSINSEGTTSTGKTSGDTSSNENEEIIFKSQGNIGVTSSAELLDKWRKTIINIDEEIIEKCKKLFMEVY